MSRTMATSFIALERGMQNQAEALTRLARATMYSRATPRGPACVSVSGVARSPHAFLKLLGS